jgi:beta-lactamase regulating signal transducer with metallopeptidase domain/Flp pilus assembly secretin CpaC
MNTVIDTLSRAGEAFCGFAWPMFLQSSLLIALIWTADRLTKKWLRPATRYALWLLVLVKLVIPPTLALPSGAAWWLRASQPSVRREAPVTVTEGAPITMPSAALRPAIAPRISTQRLSVEAVVLLAAASVSAVLLGWILLKWREVRRTVATAQAPDAALQQTLERASAEAGLVRAPRVRIVDPMVSPALCGLLRPAILLPKVLVDSLPETRIRGVLLHELIHLRRGDVWVNCAQTLLQVVYWWHPLVWLANARIRQLREEAVDDAVMVAMQNDAPEYAPTLLEVAKLALNRPMAALGLVGILESKSALRGRIERLVAFGVPKRAGLTFLSALGVLAFSAVALPMGPAPVTQNVSTNTVSTSASGVTYEIAAKPSGTNTTPASLTNGLIKIKANLPQSKEGPVSFEWHIGDPSQTNQVIQIKADQVQSNGSVTTLTGNVRVSDGYKTINADELQINTNGFSLSGTVTMTNAPSRTNSAPSAPAPQQISIEVKFIEIANLNPSAEPADSLLRQLTNNTPLADAETNLPPSSTGDILRSKFVQPENLRLDIVPPMTVTGILTEDRARALIKQIEQRPGSDMLSAPKVTTLMGRQAHIAVQNSFTIVTGVLKNEQIPGWTRGAGNEVRFLTTNVATGPSIDLLPKAGLDGVSVDLVVIPEIIEFLGYDGYRSPTNRMYLKTSLMADRPLPHFRVMGAAAHATLQDGQTLVLASPEFVVTNTVKDKIHVLGDIPLLGGIFRSETSTKVKKNMIVLVTPTLIDPAGNPIHATKPK